MTSGHARTSPSAPSTSHPAGAPTRRGPTMPPMPRRVQGVVRAALVVLLTLTAASCSDDDTVEPAAFEAEMQERFGAGLDQARCLREYAYDDYDDEAIRVLYDDGVTALPKALWDPFVLATIACLTESP